MRSTPQLTHPKLLRPFSKVRTASTSQSDINSWQRDNAFRTKCTAYFEKELTDLISQPLNSNSFSQ